jgi:hypothetical protein
VYIKEHRIAAIAAAYQDPLRAAVNLDAEQLFDAVRRNDPAIGRDYPLDLIAIFTLHGRRVRSACGWR